MEHFFIRERLLIVAATLLSLLLSVLGLAPLIQKIGFLWALTIFSPWIVIIFVTIIVVTNTLAKLISKNEIKNFLTTTDPTVAIVFGSDTLKGYLTSIFGGARFLIHYLQKGEKKIRVYIMPTKSQFKQIVENDQIRILYLIGHGKKYGFRLNDKEDFLEYSDFKDNLHRKDEIHLYHCTDSKEPAKSLIDYLVLEGNQNKCFIANDTIRIIDYGILFQKLSQTSS